MPDPAQPFLRPTVVRSLAAAERLVDQGTRPERVGDQLRGIVQCLLVLGEFVLVVDVDGAVGQPHDVEIKINSGDPSRFHLGRRGDVDVGVDAAARSVEGRDVPEAVGGDGGRIRTKGAGAVVPLTSGAAGAKIRLWRGASTPALGPNPCS